MHLISYPSIGYSCFTCQLVYSFSIVAIAHYHKHSGLSNINLFFYSSRGQMSKMGLTGLKSRFNRAALLLKTLGKNLFPCLHLLEAACIPWLVVPSFIFRARHYITPASASILTSPRLSLTTILLLPSFTYKGSCDNI